MKAVPRSRLLAPQRNTERLFWNLAQLPADESDAMNLTFPTSVVPESQQLLEAAKVIRVGGLSLGDSP